MKPPHGTNGRYKLGCRCRPCRDATARDQVVYLLRRSANGGERLMVPKLGSVRRLQALMALGWPRRELARQAGYSGDAFAVILNGRRERLFPETHQRVCDLYDRLCMTPGPSAETRRRARAAGWLPPLAWDEGQLDDPAAEPAVPADRHSHHAVDHAKVERILAGEWGLCPTATWGEKQVVARRWLAAGGSTYALEQLSGWRRYKAKEPA